MTAAKEDKTKRGRKKAGRFRWDNKDLDPREQHRRRRETLLRTAAVAFNETGFHTTTMDELAKRLNVTKPTLYYYVKDKDDILFECQRQAFEHLRGVLDELDDNSMSGMEKLTHFLAAYGRFATTDFGVCLIRTGLKPLRPESRAKLREFARQLDAALQRIIAQGVEDGSIRDCNAKLTAFAIFGGYNGIAHWYREEGEYNTEMITEAFLALFTHALTGRQTVKPE